MKIAILDPQDAREREREIEREKRLMRALIRGTEVCTRAVYRRMKESKKKKKKGPPSRSFVWLNYMNFLLACHSSSSSLCGYFVPFRPPNKFSDEKKNDVCN